MSYRVPSRKYYCYSVFVITKGGQSCLFEASARQDDLKNGKEIWIEWTWRLLQNVHMTNQRSDFLASLLEVKWSLLTYWARRCKAKYMTLKEDFETEKSNHQVFTLRESKSKWPVCNYTSIKNPSSQLKYGKKQSTKLQIKTYIHCIQQATDNHVIK